MTSLTYFSFVSILNQRMAGLGQVASFQVLEYSVPQRVCYSEIF